jgi:hypothetical protein
VAQNPKKSDSFLWWNGRWKNYFYQTIV